MTTDISHPIRIICVDKGRDLARQVRNLFSEEIVTMAYERSIDEVVDRFEQDSFDIMLFSSSVAYRRTSDAMEILELVNAKCPATQILFFAPPDGIKIANQALRAGAFHYSMLPVSDEELKLLIETVMDTRPQLGLNLLLRSEVEKTVFEQMVGRSASMQNVYRQIRHAAATDVSVLLTGETGTGKELAAQAIHELSNRSEAPCIPVHIGSLPPDLVASELFGHEAGSYTGARKMRKGCFESANGGTIFLDEIATIDAKMQISLLRLLETSRFHRIGGNKDIEVDVRIIAASNADFFAEIKRGHFREDLYYRLDVLHITMPPLRERHGDLHLLTDHFIKIASDSFQKPIRGVSSEFFSFIDPYPWPGNIRELKNVIQRAVITCSGDILEVRHLPKRLKHFHEEDISFPIHVGMSLREVEQELISHTLDFTGRNRTRTAQMLGISRRSLYNKLQRYEMT